MALGPRIPKSSPLNCPAEGILPCLSFSPSYFLRLCVIWRGNGERRDGDKWSFHEYSRKRGYSETARAHFVHISYAHSETHTRLILVNNNSDKHTCAEWNEWITDRRQKMSHKHWRVARGNYGTRTIRIICQTVRSAVNRTWRKYRLGAGPRNM